MATYNTIRSFYCDSPIILAFDVQDDKFNITLSLFDTELLNETLSINIDTNKNTGTHTEVIENNFLNSLENHEDGTFQGEFVIIETEESNSGYISSGQLINKRPEVSSNNNSIITFNESLSNLTNGSIIFFLTEEPKTDNVVHSNIGVFEERDAIAYEITPFILSELGNENADNNNSILLDLDDDSMTFLLLGNEVKKTYQKSPTTIYKKNVQDQVFYEYQSNTKELLKAPYRCRFVISNGGRMITFSKYNKSTHKWDCIRNFILNIQEVKEKQRIQITTNNIISNITANF